MAETPGPKGDGESGDHASVAPASKNEPEDVEMVDAVVEDNALEPDDAGAAGAAEVEAGNQEAREAAAPELVRCTDSVQI